MSFEPNAMMELFRAEVENHSESLTTCLMALERDPADASILESIMRSAHSLKGAARIVGVNVAVEVAHIMEDCLVAAQRGELSIKPCDVDVLLQGVDLLVRISEATKSNDAEWTPIENDVRNCVLQLKSIRAGTPLPASSIVNEPSSSQDSVKALSPVAASPAVKAEPESSKNLVPISEPQPALLPSATPPKQIGPVVLTFGKSLNDVHAEEMRLALLAALKSGADSIRYDLSQTTDLDPIGLAFLVASKQQASQLALNSLEFSPLSDEVQLVLRMSGILSP